MATTLEVSPFLGLVVFSVLLYIFTLLYISSWVMRAREKYDVQYPVMYDDSKPMFNCVQRAHQNAIEAAPMFLAALAPAALVLPLPASILSVLYSIGRLLYARGYATGDPEKRHQGLVQYVALFGLIGIDVYAGLYLLGAV